MRISGLINCDAYQIQAYRYLLCYWTTRGKLKIENWEVKRGLPSQSGRNRRLRRRGAGNQGQKAKGKRQSATRRPLRALRAQRRLNALFLPRYPVAPLPYCPVALLPCCPIALSVPASYIENYSSVCAALDVLNSFIK